jgi:secondary thiamine-phosphate synthase enzyme
MVQPGRHCALSDAVRKDKGVKQLQRMLEVRTQPYAFSNITQALTDVVRESGVGVGMCTAFIRHTSASLLIQENADPAVLRDLARWLKELAPETRAWEHDDEGKDDMPAHARSSLLRTSEGIPIQGGRLCLGTWQDVYVWEHRATPHTRQVIVHVQGSVDV